MLTEAPSLETAPENLPDARGHFGSYGGMYVPETLMTPLFELLAKRRDEIDDYLKPSELWPILETHLDSLNLHPRQTETGTAKQYNYEGGSITYENFRKSIRRIRRRWDNA